MFKGLELDQEPAEDESKGAHECRRSTFSLFLLAIAIERAQPNVMRP